MIKIDTLKLQLHEDCIKDINLNYFDKNEAYGHIGSSHYENKPREVRYILPSEYKPWGVHNIYLFKKNCSNAICMLEFSAKALKWNYFHLININTVEELINNISNKAISFKSDNFLGCHVLRADIADDLKLSNPIKHYINALFFYKVNHKYTVKKYGDNSVTFIKDNQTKNRADRIIFYDKGIEIFKDKKNLKYINPENFNNVLRVESNLKTFYQMRKYLDVTGDIILGEILKSKNKINYNFLGDITDGCNLRLINSYEGMKLHDIEKIEGMKSIINYFNCDIKLVREFIKSHFRGNPNLSNYFKEYKNLMIQIGYKNDISNKSNALIDELKNMLRAA